MKTRPVTVACVVAAIGLVGACAYAFKDRNSRTDPRLAPFEFRLEPAPTPEMAAQAMFLGVATASPRDFVRHLLLGVCENEIDTLQNFAESLRDSAVPPPVVQAAYARSANRDSPSHTSLHRQGNHR